MHGGPDAGESMLHEFKSSLLGVTARTGADDKKIVIIRHVDNPRTKPQLRHILVAGQTISAPRRPGKGNGTCVSIS